MKHAVRSGLSHLIFGQGLLLGYRFVVLLLLGFGLVTMGQLFAQTGGASQQPKPKPKMTAFLSPPSIERPTFSQPVQMRSDAPIPLDVAIRWTGKSLKEGFLQVTLYAEGENPKTLNFDTTPITVMGGGQFQHYRFLLPPLDTDRSFNLDPLQIDLDFIDSDGRFHNLARKATFFEPMVQGAFASRAFCLLSVSSKADESKDVRYVKNKLRLEQFQNRDNRYRSYIMTTISDYWPRDLPSHPLDYTAYDVVMLYKGGFSEAQSHQLEGMKTWIRAGGSLLIVAGEDIPKAPMDFLTDLAGGSPVLNPDGSFHEGVSEQIDGGFYSFRCELGRVIVAHGSLVDYIRPKKKDEPIEISPRFYEMVCELWRVREDISAEIVNRGSRGGRYEWDLEAYAGDQRGTMGVYRLLTGSKLAGSLVPESIQLVPFEVVLLLLGMFILIIGPVDYLLLGVVRFRRLTWLTFPVIAVAFFIATQKLADHYVGTSDRGDSALILDLAENGEVLRFNHYRLIFPGSYQRWQKQVDGSMLVPVDMRLFMTEQEREYFRRSRDVGEVYKGAYPGNYQYSMQLRKWTAQMLRYAKLGAVTEADLELPIQEEINNFKWDQISIDEIKTLYQAQGNANSTEVTNAFLKKLGAVAEGKTIHLFRGNRNGEGEMKHISGPRKAFRESQDLLNPEEAKRRERELREEGLGIASSVYKIEDFFREMNLRPNAGIFRGLSQISPNMASNYEDLSVLDPSDPDEYMLVISWPSGTNVVVLRRLFEEE